MGYRSGQTGQTVNLLAKPSEVRILPPPLLPHKPETDKRGFAGVAQLARASAFQAEGRGFESRLPLAAKQLMKRSDARSGSSGVERVLGKDEVAGSNPAQSLLPWSVAENHDPTQRDSDGQGEI